jgi:cysteinyl-tRNA synthetase
MLKLFNTLGRKLETFQVRPNSDLSVFTCGPSVYQRSHIGNFRTFLFEDILVRFLEFQGYSVMRGMNLTDVEDKAIEEARKKQISLRKLTEENIAQFTQEMDLLRLKPPTLLHGASEAIDEAVAIIEKLLDKGIAYWHNGNVYFDPLKYPHFGELYGLDMRRWPSKKKRFHKDTYPGMRWNLGDFILWHGEDKSGEVQWETSIGKGRPSWNVQDPSLIYKYFEGTLSIYCGGIDNLIRHHDYTRAILESIRPYPMAKFWLHGHHLYVESQKMSKSKGNIYYTDSLMEEGYSPQEIRFFLIYGHYRRKLNYSKKGMRRVVNKLNTFKKSVGHMQRRVEDKAGADGRAAEEVRKVFSDKMDDDLNVQKAFDAVSGLVSKAFAKGLEPDVARGYIDGLKQIDTVLGVIF